MEQLGTCNYSAFKHIEKSECRGWKPCEPVPAEPVKYHAPSSLVANGICSEENFMTREQRNAAEPVAGETKDVCPECLCDGPVPIRQNCRCLCHPPAAVAGETHLELCQCAHSRGLHTKAGACGVALCDCRKFAVPAVAGETKHCYVDNGHIVHTGTCSLCVAATPVELSARGREDDCSQSERHRISTPINEGSNPSERSNPSPAVAAPAEGKPTCPVCGGNNLVLIQNYGYGQAAVKEAAEAYEMFGSVEPVAGETKYPELCTLCNTMMESADDRMEWHGYGNCVEINEEMEAQWAKEAEEAEYVCPRCGSNVSTHICMGKPVAGEMKKGVCFVCAATAPLRKAVNNTYICESCQDAAIQCGVAPVAASAEGKPKRFFVPDRDNPPNGWLCEHRADNILSPLEYGSAAVLIQWTKPTPPVPATTVEAEFRNIAAETRARSRVRRKLKKD